LAEESLPAAATTDIRDTNMGNMGGNNNIYRDNSKSL